MTDKRNLAATIARAIFDRIERDRTLILQNIEEVVSDQLAIEGAKRRGDPAAETIQARAARLHDEWQRQRMGELYFDALTKSDDPAALKPHPFQKVAAPKVEWGSLMKWWQAEFDKYEATRG